MYWRGEEPHSLHDSDNDRRGIILVIVPLFALTADQLANIEEALQTHGSVKAHHLDNTLPGDLNTIIQQIHAIDYDSSSTLFLFTSPQYLTIHTAILNALLWCHLRSTLRLVAIDKALLYVQHGRLFREAMRLLTTLFFSIMFKVGIWHPLFLAMTATMTLSLLLSFAQLTNVEWTNNNNILWSNCIKFHQGYIQLDFQVNDNMGRIAYPTLIDFLRVHLYS